MYFFAVVTFQFLWSVSTTTTTGTTLVGVCSQVAVLATAGITMVAA